MREINDKEINEKDKEKKVLKKGPFCFLYKENSFLKNKSRGFIWLLKTEIIIIIVCFFIILIHNWVPNKTKFILKYEFENIGYRISNYIDSKILNFKETDYSIIEKSINANTKLKADEKNFILKYLKDEINENIDYIDLDKVAKKFETLEIIYCKKYFYNKVSKKYELQYPEYSNKNIAGRYNNIYNIIYLYEDIDGIPEDYEKKKYDFKSSNQIALFHELNHVLSEHSSSNETVIMEGINELFTRKYFENENNNIQNDRKLEESKLAYEPIIQIMYDLEKLIDKDVLSEYKFKNKEGILISYLLKIDNNIEEAYKLIDGINSINIYEKFDDTKIKEGYTYFYNKKYGN